MIQYKFKYNQMEDSQECVDQQEIAGFISKTYEILGNNQFAKIVFWSPLGDQFIIKDHNKFEQVVLPRYFRHNKMNSFIRQLNMYGFHKSRKDNSRSVFSHPSFLKEREDLLITIKRRLKCTSRTYEQTPVKPIEEDRPKNTPATGIDLRSASHISKEDLFAVKPIASNLELAYSSMDLNQSYNKLPMGSIGKMTYPSVMDLNIDEDASIEHIMPTVWNERKEGITYVNPSCFFLTSVRVNRE